MRVEEAVQKVVKTLSSWDCTEAITLMEHQDDIYDPYFFLSLDVYTRDQLPGEADRRQSFQYTGAFEPGTLGRKDRFILDDLPFRLEYKSSSRFSEIIRHLDSPTGFIRDNGSYQLYRLVNANVLYQKTSWLEDLRKACLNFSQDFWQKLRAENQAKMEHYLNDLGAAAMREDQLFFTISASGFLKSLCGTLYAINRSLEPSARFLSRDVKGLSIVPDTFEGTLDSFLREQSLHRRKEIAELLALRVIHLSEA